MLAPREKTTIKHHQYTHQYIFNRLYYGTNSTLRSWRDYRC